MQYQHLEAELQEKLGLAPAPETRALLQEGLRLQRARSPANAPARPSLSSRSQPALPFVGRESLLARLLSISREVKAGRGSTIQRPEAIPALQRLVTLERKRGRLQLLSLPPLTEEAVADLLQGLAISPTSIPTLAKWLQEQSDSNPFILDEMTAQLRGDGILSPAGDHWQLDPGRWLRWRAAYTLPETTYDLVS